MDQQRQDDQLVPIIQQLPVDTEYSIENLLGAMDDRRVAREGRGD